MHRSSEEKLGENRKKKNEGKRGKFGVTLACACVYPVPLSPIAAACCRLCRNVCKHAE